MICVGNTPQLVLHDEHGLFVVLCAVKRLLVLWMFAKVLVGGGILVVQDNNQELSWAFQPVDITTLHPVCDTARAGSAVATDD